MRGLVGMGCGGPREAGSSTAHPFHVVGGESSGTRDKDLYGAEMRTLKGHVGVGWLGGDEGHAQDGGLGGDGLWRAPRSGVLHGPSPSC